MSSGYPAGGRRVGLLCSASSLHSWRETRPDLGRRAGNFRSLGMNEHVTLMHPDGRDSAARGISSGFPADLLSQSAGRLRVLALLYAFVFFMAGIFPAL